MRVVVDSSRNAAYNANIQIRLDFRIELRKADRCPIIIPGHNGTLYRFGYDARHDWHERLPQW
jgi:hypothetical protein